MRLSDVKFGEKFVIDEFASVPVFMLLDLHQDLRCKDTDSVKMKYMYFDVNEFRLYGSEDDLKVKPVVGES